MGHKEFREPFKETFKSPFDKDTREEAEEVLDKIRASHPATSGWEEIEAHIEELPNGKYRAVRTHQKLYA